MTLPTPLAYLFTLDLRSSAPAATARVCACVRSCVRDVHAASQKRPPRAETGKTSAAQSMSKAVTGLPIVDRRGSIVPGLPRAPCPFAILPSCVHVRTSANPLVVSLLRSQNLSRTD